VIYCESLTAVLVYAVAAFGFAFIVGHSRISLPARALMQTVGERLLPIAALPFRFVLMLIECPACLGFWEGLAYALAFHPSWASWWELALFTSGSNFLLGRFSRLIPDED
jgi:hypothetical protein